MIGLCANEPYIIVAENDEKGAADKESDTEEPGDNSVEKDTAVGLSNWPDAIELKQRPRKDSTTSIR